jgi:hypothetical protein
MMALLSGLWPYLIAAGAALGVLWGMMASAKKAGIQEQKAKEAEARQHDLDRIKAAADAGARVQPDDPGMQHDPFNRDK